MAHRQGLLASPGLEERPVKGVYFFPGESAGNLDLYTVHPALADDEHWNTDPSTRVRVMDRMVAAGVNTVVMSYWSNMPQWSPMALVPHSLSGVLDAAAGRPLVVMPAIESGVDRANPHTPQWQFSTDFPAPEPGGPPSPGLIERIGHLVELFAGRMDLWARLYDCDGEARHAVQVIHACSDVPQTTDDSFAQGFADVAARIESSHGIRIGFTLDAIAGNRAYVAMPARAGHVLRRQPSVLAIHGFQSEVFSDTVRSGPPGFPRDNNVDNLGNIAAWKARTARAWAVAGLPVILDVSNGMDGRIVWGAGGVGFWGDNADYTDDRWRNRVSCLKGPHLSGLVFDTWNGYTEGYAAVPTVEHGNTVYRWLQDLLSPDPREFSHMHYARGAPAFRVYGAICEKWLELGADHGFGMPTSDELPFAHGRVSRFVDAAGQEKAIYWSGATGAHAVHGLVDAAYRDGASARLGFPLSDEQAVADGSVSFFEHGRIDLGSGETGPRITEY